MPAPVDPSAKLADYAHPERLVTTQWLADRLDESRDDLVVLESDEDVLLYDTGHIPGSFKLDWHTDLNDPVNRDFVDAGRFAELMAQRGINRDTTVVIYGDKSNWWAAYALWVLTLFGHPDARLLDGGRMAWVSEGRPMTKDVPQPAPADYPVVARDDSAVRAFRDDVLAHLGGRMVDVRSPGEFSGELLHMPDYPRRVRCAAATSRGHPRCRGLAPPPRTADSSHTRSFRRSTQASRACAPMMTSSSTAGSVSVPRTHGSC